MRLVLLGLVVLSSGCYPTPRVDAWKYESNSPDGTHEPEPLVKTSGWKRQREWNDRLGQYRYRDALSDMGPPASSVEADGVLVAVWESSGPLVIAPVFRSIFVSQRVRRLILTFDQETKLLVDYQGI